MKKLLPWILAGAFCIVGVATLPDYGMNEDSPFHFLRGQYFLERLLGRSGKFDVPTANSPVLFVPGQRVSAYKTNATEEIFSPVRPISQYDNVSLQKAHQGRQSFYKHNAWTGNIWELPDNQVHPAVSDMLMATTNRVTYEMLGVLSDVDGYHVYSLIVVSIALAFLYLFVSDTFGSLAAAVSVISLALYPMVWAESHFNIKDPVQMGFYTMAIVSWYFTVTRRLSVKWLIVCILSVFLALGTKWNILFAPFTLVPWTVWVWYKTEVHKRMRVWKLLLYGILGSIIPFILLLIAYPWFWTQTWDKLLNTFNYYAFLSVRDLRVEQASLFPLPGGLDARAFLYFIAMSPPVMLVLAFLGTVGLMARKYAAKNRAGVLVAMWFIVPFTRVIWQVSEVFGSLRNFMEFLPAFAVLVGVGSAWIVKRVNRRIFYGIFLGVFILIQAAILIRLHPYEHLYFSPLVGGFRGAQAMGLYTWETLYDVPYRQLAAWLNTHAEKDTRLAHLDGTMFALSPLWLRDDIRIGTYFSGFDGKGEYIASIVYPKPPGVFPYNYVEEFVKPVYEVKADGVTIAKIWKNDAAHTRMFGSGLAMGADALRIETSQFRGTDRVDTIMPSTLRILNVAVVAEDIRCITEQRLVWSVVDGAKETYMVPWMSQASGTSALLWFPGTSGNVVRFWDIEGSGCAGRVHVTRVESLQ